MFCQNPESRNALGSLKGKLITICDDVHRLSRQIHPAILDDFGLEDALRNECVCFEDRHGIKATLHCGELPLDLPKEIALCLFRIVQEAMWNTAKYANTDQVTVGLNSDSEFIHLEVYDLGCGFDPSHKSASMGLGLASMNERARLVRGTFSITSTPGHGVKIVVQIPLPGHSS